ncbi:hypothetical protein HOLleu_25335 [Holothuria leucospilota]|uniref:Uncharacterized protein n=1 Tax=Holothuria leucospilota TaxID=206669 RepID=A0A9Q1BSG2_HOLLE|nr:hypothetical protein HOLleu_25335 [Holothuria leucospilota]
MKSWCHPNNAVLKYHSCTPKINEDFNHFSLIRSSIHYYQHVACPASGYATLDLFYSNVKEAYNSSQLLNLGDSGHNLVFLQPKYRPLVKRQKPQFISVKQWNSDAIGKHQGALECTDWDVFIHSNSDLDSLVQTVIDYISFCTELAVPTRRIKIFPNNKPLITKPVKVIMNKKKGAFGRGIKTEWKKLQKSLKSVIDAERKKYKSKIENNFTKNDMKRGIRLMSGFSNGSSKSSQVLFSTPAYANDLNKFYNRFECHDCQSEINALKESYRILTTGILVRTNLRYGAISQVLILPKQPGPTVYQLVSLTFVLNSLPKFLLIFLISVSSHVPSRKFGRHLVLFQFQKSLQSHV